MSILCSEPSHVHAESAVDRTNAWLLGYALGCHSEINEPPTGYTPDECCSFREGWILGEHSRIVTRGWPVELRRDELGEFLAELHGEDHDAQPDPFAIEAWAMPNDEWYDAEAMADEPDPDTQAEWDARACVMNGRASAAQEGRAA